MLIDVLLMSGLLVSHASGNGAEEAQARRAAMVEALSNDARTSRYEAARRARDACAECATDPVAERLILGVELQIDAMSVAECASSHARRAAELPNGNERLSEALAKPEQHARLQAGYDLLQEIPGAPERFRPDDAQDAGADSRALYHALIRAPMDLCRAHDRVEPGSDLTVVDRLFPGTCQSDDGILVQSYALLLAMDALAPQSAAECALDASMRERMTRARTHFPAIAAAMPPPPGPFDP